MARCSEAGSVLTSQKWRRGTLVVRGAYHHAMSAIASATTDDDATKRAAAAVVRRAIARKMIESKKSAI
jgi:hypothetical protein